MLIAIGYWISGLADDLLPAPQELVGFLDPELRASIARHLDTGQALGGDSRPDWCRFLCPVSAERLGVADLTDGIWAWPSSLAHYVRAHQVALPSEFSVAALAHRAPATVPGRPALDFGFWLDWCRPRRSPHILGQLRAARGLAECRDAAARARCERILADALGVDRATCSVRGCARRALLGGTRCARHALRADAEDTERIHRSLQHALLLRVLGGSLDGH